LNFGVKLVIPSVCIAKQAANKTVQLSDFIIEMDGRQNHSHYKIMMDSCCNSTQIILLSATPADAPHCGSCHWSSE